MVWIILWVIAMIGVIRLFIRGRYEEANNWGFFLLGLAAVFAIYFVVHGISNLSKSFSEKYDDSETDKYTYVLIRKDIAHTNISDALILDVSEYKSNNSFWSLLSENYYYIVASNGLAVRAEDNE